MAKRFTLKKTVAFMMSLALVAGSAAYLPAGTVSLFDGLSMSASALENATKYASYFASETLTLGTTTDSITGTEPNDKIEGEGTEAEPYVFEMKVGKSAAGIALGYGHTISYNFTADVTGTLGTNAVVGIVSGGSGKVTFGDSLNATTDVIKVKVDGANYAYIKVKFVIDDAFKTLDTEAEGTWNDVITGTVGTPTATAGIATLTSVEAAKGDAGAYLTGIAFTKITGDKAMTVESYKGATVYAKNIDVALDADIKANETLTLDLSKALASNITYYVDGTTGADKNKITVTPLDNSGKATALVKIVNELNPNDVEYIKFNFALVNKSFSVANPAGITFSSYAYAAPNFSSETEIPNSNLDVTYTTTGGNGKYVALISVRDTAPANGKVIAWNITAASFTNASSYEIANSQVNNGSTGVVTITKSGVVEQVKFVFDENFTLKLNENYGENKETEMPAKVGGFYDLKKPTRTGYTFVGWYTSAESANAGTPDLTEYTTSNLDGQVKTQSEIAASTSTTLYAAWKANEFTVALNANGGEFSDGVIGEGAWSIEEKLAGKNVLIKMAGTNKYTYDATTGNTLANATTLKLSRDGGSYTLIGWSTNKDTKTPEFAYKNADGVVQDTVKLNNLTATKDAVVTLFAIWQASDATITPNIEKAYTGFKTVDGLNTVAAEMTSLTSIVLPEDFTGTTVKGVVGDAFPALPTPTLKGFTFQGWYYDANTAADKIDMKKVDSTSIVPETATEVVPYFTIDTFTITYDDFTPVKTSTGKLAEKFSYGTDTVSELDTDTLIDTYSSNPVLVDVDGAAASETLRVADNNTTTKTDIPQKSGYIFKGYTINGIVKNAFGDSVENFKSKDVNDFLANSSLTYYKDATTTAQLQIGAENVVIAAVWEVDTTKGLLNVDFDGATIKYTNDQSGKTVIVKPTSSIYSKYALNLTGEPDSQIKLGTGITPPTGAAEWDDGAYVTLTDYGFDIDNTEFRLEKTGYTFGGWFTKNDKDEEVAFSATKFTAGVTNVYAKWIDNNPTTTTTTTETTTTTTTTSTDEPTTTTTTTTTTTETPVVEVAPVSGLKQSVGNAIVWTKSADAAYYEINTGSTTTKTYNVSYAFQGLTAGKSYTISVTAVDADGNKSIAQTTTLKAVALLAKPTGLAVDANRLSWEKVEGAVKYKVYVIDVNNNNKYVAQKSGVLNTAYTFGSLKKGTTYKLRVCAIDKDGVLGKSSTTPSFVYDGSTYEEPVAVAPVTNLKNVSGNAVNWTKSADAVSYKIYVDGKASASTNNGSYAFQNMTAGQTYKVGVAAVNAEGKESAISEVSFKAVTLLAKPTGLKRNGNVLSWTAVANAAKYKVYIIEVRADGSMIYVAQNARVSKTSYTFKSLEKGKSYKLRVCAVDANGYLGKTSTSATFTF